jgi:hypothetical protein
MEQSAIYELHSEIFEFVTKGGYDITCPSKHIALKVIEENPNCGWDWFWVGRNPNVTLEYILANKCKPSLWWFGISRKPSITFECILSNLDKFLNWTQISSLSDVTLETVSQYPDLPWCWIGLSINSNITWEPAHTSHGIGKL